MATHTNLSPTWTLSSDAVYRTFVSQLLTAATSCGLVRTSDTGQVNEATVTRPAQGAISSPLMFRFNDAQQANMPLYLSIGPGRSTSDTPRIAFQVGTSTDGASVITGQAGTVHFLECTTGSAFRLYASGGEGRFHLCYIDKDTTNANVFLSVERSFDSAGNATNDGALTFSTSAGVGGFVQVIPLTGTVPAGASNFTPVFPSSAPFGQTQAGTPLRIAMNAGQFCANGKPFQTRALMYRHADVAELNAQSVAVYGQTATYLPLGDGGPFTTGGGTGACAIPWS